jgi:hypothetical protein
VMCRCRAEVASEKSATKAASTQALSGTRVLTGIPNVGLLMVEPSYVPLARVGGSPLFLLSLKILIVYWVLDQPQCGLTSGNIFQS